MRDKRNGEEPSQRVEQLGHGTARRVRRRGAPTVVLGVRARRECRVESPRSYGRSRGGADWGRGEEAARGRETARGHRLCSVGRNRGGKREKEREEN